MERIKKFGHKNAQALLPRRKNSDNKATGGRTLIAAGSQGMFGAAVLAATAAARVGSGYVTLMTDQSKFLSARNPEFLIVDFKVPLNKIKFSAVGVGPGLSKTLKARAIIQKILKLSIENVVLDADALNIYAEKKSLRVPSSWILTPHEGELARLLKVSVSHIRKDRKKAVRDAQKKIGGVIILKGHKTLVATSTHIYEIQSGNVALAKAGTGDVLTGMITGFLAQGLSSVDAACLGVYVHGWLADQWVRKGNDYLSFLPTDLIGMLPAALAKLRLK